MENGLSSLICLCGSSSFTLVFTYTAPPEGEIRFQFSAGGEYHREVFRCDVCGHFLSRHEMDVGALYEGDYVNSNYADDDGIRRTFDRINSLAPSRSDNTGRVKRVLEFAAAHFGEGRDSTPTILDVGSGLCVFLHRMKEAGWDCTALDPDARSAKHARETVGIKALCRDFMSTGDLGRFDVITFNKVLEHVKDPVEMLSKAAMHLKRGGFVYVELPDGEEAVVEGPGREEFFIDHWHIFSAASIALLASRAGLTLRAMERLREPSTKYTLRAFLTCSAS